MEVPILALKWILSMNKSFLIILLFIGLSGFADDSLIVSSTDTSQHHYLSINLGTNYYKHLDFQSSPLLYSGPLAGGSLAFESDGRKHKFNIVIGGYVGFLDGDTKYVSYSATESMFNLSGKYIHSVGKDNSKIQQYIGGQVNNNLLFYYNQNLQNAALTTTLLNNLTFIYELEKQFSWKSKQFKVWFIKFNRRDRKLKANFEIGLPIFFYNLRPPYSTINDFSDGESKITFEPQSYWISGNAFQLNTATSITYYLSNNNAFRVSYKWQSFRFRETFGSFQTAQHILEFSLLFKFN